MSTNPHTPKNAARKNIAESIATKRIKPCQTIIATPIFKSRKLRRRIPENANAAAAAKNTAFERTTKRKYPPRPNNAAK